ncbi:hypothetical protein diail_10115, partial [Diaporthe ilicicola]
MATPQSMKPAPSQQGKTPQQSYHGATGTPGASASTPYSNLHAFSPHGPRSSPQQIKKSPATSGTLLGSNNQPGAAPMNFDSPSAAAFMASFDASLVDNMAISSMGMPRPSGDEERQKRLDDVIQILGQKKGIVSEEGLERLARRFGLEGYWEDVKPNKVFFMAGNTVDLEIVMKNHVAQKVQLQFIVSQPSVTKFASKAEAILFDDLKLAPGQHPWNKSLHNFAANLECLVVLDRLSVVEQVNGENTTKPHLILHDAVAGVFESLDKLHEWDVKRLQENAEISTKGDDHIRVTAMCERNGRPVMHERGRVGLCLDYWRERRLYIPRSEQAKEKYKSAKTWRILVGCAQRDPLYPAPVRVSSEWLADGIELPAADGLHEPMLNWQQPPDCILPGDDGSQPHDGLMALTGPKLPDVMFTATFDPPVTLPYSVWIEMRHVTGAPVGDPPPFMPTFDSLLFPPGSDYNAAEPRMITTTKIVKAFTKDKKQAPKTHENRLFIHKPVYGQALTELPFSHPSQLVAMLPTLRQYAFLQNLLDRAFGNGDEKAAASAITKADKPVKKITAKADEFDAWMNESNKDTEAQEGELNNTGASSGEGAVKIDVTLNAHPQPNPKLQIMFPYRGRPAQITVDIERNGVVQVESCNIVDDEGRAVDEMGSPVEGTAPNPAWSKERLGRRL